MRIFAFPLFLNLCYVLSSPAVRRADLSTPTSIPQPSSTTPSDSDWFWWSNGQNTTYGGYYPEWDQCPKEGTTCEEACGLGAVECGTLGNNCYFPGLGDQCCYQWGESCWAGTKCAYTNDDFLCCDDDESADDYPTSSYPASGTSLIDRTTILMTKDHYITVTASTPTSTPTDSLQVFKSSESSSSSGMTVGAKIGVGIGVPVAALALGLLGVFVWFRAVKRHRSKTPEMKPPWGVDAQESHLTPEEYERTKNQKPPEDDEVHATYDGEPDGPNAPPRSSFLQVSPLSRNRDSMATSSVNTTSPSVNYTPIPFNDLPELVDGPTK